MMDFEEEYKRIERKEFLEKEVKNLKINYKASVIKHMQHTAENLILLTFTVANAIYAFDGGIFNAVAAFMCGGALAGSFITSPVKKEYKKLFNDKKELLLLKEELIELKSHIIDVEPSELIPVESKTYSYQKHI